MINNEEKKRKLLDKVKDIDSQIDVLRAQKERVIFELDNLDKSISVSIKVSSQNYRNSASTSEFSKSEKINLFRRFFRGRDDVYAHLWVSSKTGKSGYSPVCKNEWVTNICQKPAVKCIDCPNRELVPLDDDIIRKHLEGKHVIGIYPMLKDERCYFLAVDFDGESWMNDVFAFRATCFQEGVPVGIERSRSGNGAHAWIFFEDSVPASLARNMGSFLITKTMAGCYQLDMKSYDRLFPNQDTLPKGGFGNLIALPFQRKAVLKGNSAFIDESGVPYKDQWGYLFGLKKMVLKNVEKIAREAAETGEIIDVRMTPVEEKDLPWMRLPSGRRRYKPEIKDLPDVIKLVIANRIYIKTGDVPSIFLNQLKKLAAFQNPEFYKKQSMRLSTYLTPRVISCSDILDGYLSLPRGCFEDICSLMAEYGVRVDIKDERVAGKRTNFKFCGTLTDVQKTASRKVLKNEIGILSAPPGSGKTVFTIYMVSKRKTNTLILVHRKPLMEQWRIQLASFLGLNLKDIGQIGAGKNKANGNLDVAMIQSLEKKGVVDDRVIDYGFVIVDECHHVGAVSFERVLTQVRAKYVLGLTATPYRRDGHQPIIHMQCGPIACQIKQKEVSQNIFKYKVKPQITEFEYVWSDESNIYDLWPNLVSNGNRNKKIIDDIVTAVRMGRFPIILTERREHLGILYQMLEKEIEHLIVLHGGIRSRQRKEAMEKLSSSSGLKNRAILATGSYIGEGFDNPELDTLFITMPVSFKGRLVQYAGRLHRKHKDKRDVKIYDYVDEKVPVLWKMYKRRLKTYKAMGYEVLQ